MRALLVVALLALPTSSACVLAGEPAPGPGRIWVYSIDGTLLHDIAVADRELGASCELWNFLGLSPNGVAWFADGLVHRLDFRTSIITTSSSFDQQPRGTVLDEGLLVRNVDEATTWTLHAWDGTTREVPLPSVNGYLAWSDGFFGLVSAGQTAEDQTIRLYHLASGTPFTPPYQEVPVAAGLGWQAYRRDQAIVKVDAHGTSWSLPVANWGILRENEVWDVNFDRGDRVVRQLYWNGTEGLAFATAGDLVAASATHLVVTSFSSPDGAGNEPSNGIPAISIAAVVGALLAALSARRRR